MTDAIPMKGMALASLTTSSLVALYQGHHQYKCTLPRDFLINTLLVREFGQEAITNHGTSTANQYQKYISHLTEQLQAK